MKHKSYLLLIILTFIVTAIRAQYVNVTLSERNEISGGDGQIANPGEGIGYVLSIQNISGSDITDVRLSVGIPAGTTYKPGTTRYYTSNIVIQDVAGKMPFDNPDGGYYGTIPQGTTLQLIFSTNVICAAGSFMNHLTFRGKVNGADIYATANSLTTNVPYNPLFTGLYGILSPTLQPTPSSIYTNLRIIDPTTGEATNTTPYTGLLGRCQTVEAPPTALRAGALLKNGRAIAWDRRNKRLYFTTTALGEKLSYIDPTSSPVIANQFIGTTDVLEPNATDPGQIINRMGFSLDYYGYALTANGQDLIRFEVPESGIASPVIQNLGPLVNHPANGTHDVLSETEGDLIGDGANQLYLITGGGRLYRIIPATRVATYLGSISNLPANFTITAAADAGFDFDRFATGTVLLAGYSPVDVGTGTLPYSSYTLDMATLSATLLSSTTSLTSAIDFAGARYAPYNHLITATQRGDNVGTNEIDFTVTVANIGNLSAAGVQVYDPIPDNSEYVPNSTTVNGVAVPDISGQMPFALAGGTLVPNADGAGLLKAGDANKVVIKFRVQTSQDGLQVCHQAQVTYYDLDNNPMTLSAAQSTTGQLVDGCLNARSGARKANADTTATPSNGVVVSPNPFVQNLNIKVGSAKDESVVVKLTNLQGSVVYTTVKRLSAGVNNFNITLPAELPHGIYIIELVSGTKRIYKQKIEKL